MLSVAPTLTEFGKSLLVQGISGEQIVFTKFKLGNGEISADDDVSQLMDLKNPLVPINISSVDSSATGYYKVSGMFGNTDISEDFRWTEIGLFATGAKTQAFNGDGETTTFTVTDKPSIITTVRVSGNIATVSGYNAETGVVTLSSAPEDGIKNVVVSYPDTENEHLYAYLNDGDDAGKLKASLSNVVTEESFSLIVTVGTASEVYAILSESALYATKDELNAHKAAENPHNIQPATLGLDRVDNVSTNDQTPTYTIADHLEVLESGETMSTLLSKVALAVRGFIAHIINYNNPHRLTAQSINAADKNHTHQASDMVSGILGIARGGTGVQTYEALRRNLGLEANAGVAFGTYNGTGTYGSSNKKSIKFASLPKLLVVMPRQNTSHGQYGGFIVLRGTASTRGGGIMDDVTGDWGQIYYTWGSDGTVTWYSDRNAYTQQNVNGMTYTYFAIL